jgi:DNA polymerase III subunit delta
MSIKPDALTEALKRGLKPLYVLVGDEALLAQESADAIRAAARAQGYAEREVFTVDQYFKWDVLQGATQSVGLFADKKIMELRMPTGKPGRDGGEALAKWAGSLQGLDTVLCIVTLPKPDGAARKSGWFTALQTYGLEVNCDTVARAQLPPWIAARLRRHGLSAPDDVLRGMAEHMEGNLLAAHQEIEKLALLYPKGVLTAEQVHSVMADVARYDVFQLSEAVLAGDVPRLLRMLEGLRAEGESPVLVHFTLAQDARQLLACKEAVAMGRSVQMAIREAGVWGPRQYVYERVLPRLSGSAAKALSDLVREAAAVDLICKGLPQRKLPREPWQALQHLALSLTQIVQAAPAKHKLALSA